VPLRRETAPPRHHPKTSGAGALLFTFLTCAILGGLTYAAVFEGLSWRARRASGTVSPSPVSLSPVSPSRVPPSRTAGTAAASLPLRDMTEVVLRAQPVSTARRANILIFTARPGSIATARPTNLCYAVSDAALARIEPGVGDVDPAATLTCR